MFTIKHMISLFCFFAFAFCLLACGSDKEENPVDVCELDSFSCKGNMLMVCNEDHEFVPYLMCPQGMCNSDKGNCKPDQNSQAIFEQSKGLCESVACAEDITIRPLCVYVAEALSSYMEENRLALEEAFKTYESFDWSDTTYDLVSAYNLYKTSITIEKCDTEGVAENADQVLRAFNALLTFEGFDAAMTDAVNKCANGGCVLN